jgi:hypothetical protein
MQEGQPSPQYRLEQHVGNKYQVGGILPQLRCNVSSLSVLSHIVIEGIPEANLFFRLMLCKTNRAHGFFKDSTAT